MPGELENQLLVLENTLHLHFGFLGFQIISYLVTHFMLIISSLKFMFNISQFTLRTFCTFSGMIIECMIFSNYVDYKLDLSKVI